jgi:hypothetical protein
MLTPDQKADTRVRFFRYALTLTSACIALGGCGQDPNGVVTVTYDQVSNFEGYARPFSGASVTEPGVSFTIYRIISVDNTGSKAQQYTLDPLDAKTFSSQGFTPEHASDEFALLGELALTKVTVKPGAKLVGTADHAVGCIIMKFKDTQPATLVHGHLVNLAWSYSGDDPKVDLVRLPSNKTVAVTGFPASSTTLAHQCENKLF